MLRSSSRTFGALGPFVRIGKPGTAQWASPLSALVGLLGLTVLSCSSSGNEGTFVASSTGANSSSERVAPGAGSKGSESADLANSGAPLEATPAQGEAPRVGGVQPSQDGSEGTPAPALEPSVAPAAGSPEAPKPAQNSDSTAPVQPPVSDTASPLPVARQGGYTTDANLIYGPLPEQRLDVLYPAGAGPNGTEQRPGVIMFHGGGWIQGDKATMSSFYSRFLAHGFIVATVEYRVARQGIAPAAVEDALLAAKWFWDHMDYYKIDKSKYVVTGASAGGHLALMVGMATAEAGLGPAHPADFQIAAIINGYGPADVTDMLQRNIGFALDWLPGNTPNREAIARQVSPVTYVRQDLPPLLTVQGSNDNTVPVAEGVALDQLLKAAGADAEHHLVDGAGHGFTTPATAWPDAEKTIFDFLVRHGIGH
jgi:acetyl esterase/lipase